jgi:hypothetical protein
MLSSYPTGSLSEVARFKIGKVLILLLRYTQSQPARLDGAFYQGLSRLRAGHPEVLFLGVAVMRTRLFCLAFVVGLGVAAWASLPGSAAEKPPDAAKIASWIEQLGSGSFEEREKAEDELEAVGAPALEGLRKAAKDGEEEVRRRAEKLIQRIERRLATETALEPKEVHFKFKDTPIAEAVAEIVRKTEYNIQLFDPQKKLAERKVTLDTGETTFWQGLDQFCEKAGLVEATQQDLQNQAFPAPTAPGAPPPPRMKNDQQGKAGQAEAIAAQVKAAEAAAVQAKAQRAKAIAAQVAPPPLLPIGGQPGMPAMGVAVRRPPLQHGPHGVIYLMDGKFKKLPTSYSGAVRIRALPPGSSLLGGAPSVEEIQLGLEVSPEPKLDWYGVTSVKTTRAVDDQDQELAQAMVPSEQSAVTETVIIAQGQRVVVRTGRMIPNTIQAGPAVLRLKKGEMAAKSLKELKGALTAQIIPPAQPMLTIENILKAGGETKNANGVTIKVVEAAQDKSGQLTLKLELERGNDVIPSARPMPVPLPVNRVPGGMPGGALLPAPAVPPMPAKIQFQVALPAGVPMPAQAKPVLNGGVGGSSIGFGGGTGLSLLDEKGKTMSESLMELRYLPTDNGSPRMVVTLAFKPEKDQTPSKLVFSGSKMITVEVPFNLKDVPVQ